MINAKQFVGAMQRVVELDEAAWAALKTAAVQRLKRLMTGVADPARLAKALATQDAAAAAAAKRRAAAAQQRRLEKQK